MTRWLDLHVRPKVDQPELLLQIESGGLGIFGPSGVGKSRLVDILAGHFTPSGITLRLDDRVLQSPECPSLPAHQRPLGVVFQDPRLFPHLSVNQNIRLAFEVTKRVFPQALFVEIAEQLDICGLLDRPARRLSGGEARRVALTRTLIQQPRTLILDEPFAGLDPTRKRALITLLEDKRTTPGRLILVSHDLNDLIRLCPNLLLMSAVRAGRSGPTSGLINALHPSETALWLGQDSPLNVIDIQGAEIAQDGLTNLRPKLAPDLILRLPASDPLTALRVSRLSIAARDISLSLTPLEGVSVQNQWSVQITQIAPFSPGQSCLTLSHGALHLKALIASASCDTLSLSTGRWVTALIKAVALNASG
ncbi:MAG: ATP-binding cassette domain-containing protein [Asticcacaulis sp.]